MVCLLPIISHQAVAQAVGAATWPTGDTSPDDQPLAGQQLGTNLTLNQGINTINAENESFNRFGLGLSASGGAETNFFGSETDKVTVGYGQFAGEAGVLLHTDRTQFFALYRPQYNLYPQFPQVNNYAQSLYIGLDHAITEHTGIAWNTTAARYLSLDQFLPQTLGIGGIGVVAPTLGALLQQDSFEITNAATNLQFRYLISTRMTFTGTLTAGYFLLVPAHVAASFSGFTERFISTGADLRLTYLWTPRDTVGAEVTPIYIYGLHPSGQIAVETVQGTYQRQLTSTLSARVGAGPLFIQSSSTTYNGKTYPSAQNVNYAVSASLSRQIRQSQFTAGYSRAILVNLFEPGLVANLYSFSAYLPFERRWIFTSGASYIEEGLGGAFGSIKVFGASGQMSYQIASKVQLFALYSRLSEDFGNGLAQQPYRFTRNQFGAGIRFNLGNPIASPITNGGTQ